MTASARPIDQSDDGKVLTIIEHLQELRTRVMWSAIALIVAVLISIWPLTKYTIHFLVIPAQDQLPGFKLHQFQLLDYWSTYFRVSLLLGIALAMPVIMYEVLAFVAPGLTKTERRWLYPIVAGASIMFVIGMAFGYYVELPPALKFLLKPNTSDVEPTIGVQTYIDTVTRLLLVTGLVFEMPFVIMGLAKIGVVTSKRLWGWKRYALLLAFVLAAIVTPSIDPITQTVVALPIIALYFAGMLLAKLVEGNSFLGARS
ncbi:MAG TPA: twin-arginine translocase subunit TatC [Dehalococcoidia bacterium]|nr:twin-arginine translocase subunit TatC [Dehalococcoidia bacterium]